jgi:hypothetical protein
VLAVEKKPGEAQLFRGVASVGLKPLTRLFSHATPPLLLVKLIRLYGMYRIEIVAPAFFSAVHTLGSICDGWDPSHYASA